MVYSCLLHTKIEHTVGQSSSQKQIYTVTLQATIKLQVEMEKRWKNYKSSKIP